MVELTPLPDEFPVLDQDPEGGLGFLGRLEPADGPEVGHVVRDRAPLDERDVEDLAVEDVDVPPLGREAPLDEWVALKVGGGPPLDVDRSLSAFQSASSQ